MKIRLVVDPNWGNIGIYANDKLVFDFYGDTSNEQLWKDALEDLFSELEIDYDSESRWQLGRKIPGYFDIPDEWESYWPEDYTDLPPPEVFDESGIPKQPDR